MAEDPTIRPTAEDLDATAENAIAADVRTAGDVAVAMAAAPQVDPDVEPTAEARNETAAADVVAHDAILTLQTAFDTVMSLFVSL